MQKAPQSDLLALLDWQPWQVLGGAWLSNRLPDLPGLYRIRRVGHTALDYLGQTGAGGMTLKKRLGMLRGVYSDQMPYRDPHTAGPALWALRDATGCEFEVSVVPVEGSTPWRKGLECVAISLYRQECGTSPTVNFGRMPPGYRMSTSNNARLVAAGKRFRGGRTESVDESHHPSIAPAGRLAGEPDSPSWCGHVWSPWVPIVEAQRRLSVGASGLYRIRHPRTAGLLYIGQGRVSIRLGLHQRKTNDPAERQSEIFAGPLECSWVLNDDWYTHQRLELENDLIAAYMLVTGTVPAAQFIG